MKIIASLIFIFIGLFSGCTKSNTSGNEKSEEQVKRESTFLELQKFIDKKYPDWKVKGIRKEETEIDENVNDRITYLLLLGNGETETCAFVIKADFEDVDGKIVTSLFEPSIEDVKKFGKKAHESNFQVEDESAIIDPRYK